MQNEPPHEKTNNLGFQTGLTRIGLYSLRSRLVALKFGFKKRDCTILVAEKNTLAQLAASLIYSETFISFEPSHEKTNNLHMRKQKRRSAVQ